MGNENLHTVIKGEYEALLNTLMKNYDASMRNQTIHHSQNSLKEIQQLLRIDDETFVLTFDDVLKLKMRQHIIFIKVLTQAVDKILREEALKEYSEHIEQTQALLRFKELDNQAHEQRSIAFEHVRQLINQEREFILYAMLSMNLDIVNLNIDNLKKGKTQIKLLLVDAQRNFHEGLNNKLVSSNLFQHLTANEIQAMNVAIKQICDDVDARYLYPKTAPTPSPSTNTSQSRQILSFGAQPPYQKEQEAKKTLKKNKKIMKFLKKHHEKKIKEASGTLTDLPRLEKLAKVAIKYHEEYASEKSFLEKKIKKVELKLSHEQNKKQHCLDKINQVGDPIKRNKYKKTIEKSYSKLETKYTKEKDKLQKKKADKVFCDTAVMSLHPEVFKTSDATLKKDGSPKSHRAGQHQWKTHLASKDQPFITKTSHTEEKKNLKDKPKGKDQ